MLEATVIGSIRHYLGTLPALGIHADRGALFGSYALGRADEYSDIDLIVIAPEFDGSREISLVKALWRATVCDNRIEPIPCGKRETDQGRPVLEIARREGIVITA